MYDERYDYQKGTMEAGDLEPNPVEQFRQWFAAAQNYRGADGKPIREPHAMSLATVDDRGQPHVRTVLLREIRESGIVFYTNYDSDKGVQLQQDPRAALCFHWSQLERQVRVTGVVEKITPQESDAYFASRPRKSRIAAASSPQSQVVSDRATLEARFTELTSSYREEEPIPRPDHWGGYSLRPDMVEFWQGRRHRLHDRFRYLQDATLGSSWKVERLAP